MIVDSWVNKRWPEHPKYKWKYNFQLSSFGFPYVEEIKSWVEQDPKNRSWGNLGYVHCNSDEDAMMVVLRWA